MNPFVYDVPTKVYFGENQLKHLGKTLLAYGKRVALVYGGGSIKKTGLYDSVKKEIADAGLEFFEFGGIEPNPRVTSVNRGAQFCRDEKIDVLLAAGGGSVIDAAKAIGAASRYDGDAWDLVTKKAPVSDCIPIVAVLTLAAAGSEMDAGSVISNIETGDKLPFFSALMRPKAAFLDPANTYSVSAFQTACGAADIFSHVVEVYFNMEQDMYMLDCFMEGIMKTVLKYAPVALSNPESYEARANLMWASSWAINDLLAGGKKQAWSCHRIEHALSAYYDVTHGLGLAILTPRWMRYILDERTAPRLCQFGRNVFGLEEGLGQMAAAKKSIELLSAFFFDTLKLDSTLTKLGIDGSRFGIMAEKATGGGVLPGFAPLSGGDIEAILRMCL